jgi:alanine racemase
MLPVVELRARIVQIRNLERGESIGDDIGCTVRRRTRLALVSVGYADGYPCVSEPKLQALVGAWRCPVLGRPSMDLLPIDVTDLPDRSVARCGEMVTLIGGEIGIDALAAAIGSTGREVLSRLGSRFHRIYYAT